MIIGIVGPAGVGKGVAADFLAQRIPGAIVKPLAAYPDLLKPPAAANGTVVIVPDVQRAADAAQIRRHGNMVVMYGRAMVDRARYPGSVDIDIDERDWLIGNHRGMPELYEALSAVVVAIDNKLSKVS